MTPVEGLQIHTHVAGLRAGPTSYLVADLTYLSLPGPSLLPPPRQSLARRAGQARGFLFCTTVLSKQTEGFSFAPKKKKKKTQRVSTSRMRRFQVLLNESSENGTFPCCLVQTSSLRQRCEAKWMDKL